MWEVDWKRNADVSSLGHIELKIDSRGTLEKMGLRTDRGWLFISETFAEEHRWNRVGELVQQVGHLPFTWLT